jgi:hypothetical protein
MATRVKIALAFVPLSDLSVFRVGPAAAHGQLAANKRLQPSIQGKRP